MTAAVPVGVSIFDLDSTLTRHPTYTPLLVSAARQVAPLRLALAPAVIGAMIAYKAGLIGRRRVKEIEQRLLIGGSVPRAQVDRFVAGFVDRLDRSGLFDDGRARIAHEREAGREVVLATAANLFYAGAIAQRLRIDAVVATRSVWQGDRLTARIDGENCYGAAKRRMVEAHFRAQGRERADLHIRFFSDHASDLPMFEWADEPHAVNPTRALRRLADARGWPILQWS